MGISFKISIICIIVMVASALALRFVKDKHSKDVSYQKQMKAKAEAYKRKTMQKRTPEEIFDETDDVYSKDEYDDEDGPDGK